MVIGDGGDSDSDSDNDGGDGEDFVGEMMLGRQPVYRRLQSSSRRGPTRWAPICNMQHAICNIIFAIGYLQ